MQAVANLATLLDDTWRQSGRRSRQLGQKKPVAQFLASISANSGCNSETSAWPLGSTSTANTFSNKMMNRPNLPVNRDQGSHIVGERDREVLEVFGPSLQFMVAPQSSDEAPCVMKGTIPPGVSVPIHSHAGVEAFFVISGDVEVLSEAGGNAHWIAAGPGDFIEVPSKAKHGFRNRSEHPVVQLITMTSKLGRFFQEVGRSINQGATVSPPSPDEMQRFLRTAERYGYWLATPEENALVGISLF